jgi:signal transduction histidine kinase/CheY-like chemotaxis protein
VYNDISDEMLVATTPEPARLEALRAVGMRAVLLAAIRVRGRILGAISLVSAESERRYDETDIALVEELGRRAGVALENSHLYRTAQEAARVAEEASRAKDEFLATVSHELRTPLSAIVGWSTLLKDRITDPALVKPVQVIHRNAQAQIKIIDDILDVSRVITGKFRLEAKPTDLVSVAREAMDVVRPSAIAKNIALKFNASTAFCLLVADPDRLQQVVWNLLSNSVKFTSQGGTIRMSVQQEGSCVVLSVTDDGKGIEPAFLPFVFDRFKQADSSITRRVGGLGLGLALVRHIVELHGGQVAVVSDGDGKGATFTVTLPIRAVAPVAGETTAPPSVPAPAPQSGVDLQGVRVLVVDDEQDARDLITAVLVGAGAVVESAQSPSEGLDVFRRFRPTAIVSDIGMPGEDGYSFIRRIRKLPMADGGTVPALALTAFTTGGDRARALAAGYTMHLGKPVEPATLASATAELAGLAGFTVKQSVDEPARIRSDPSDAVRVLVVDDNEDTAEVLAAALSDLGYKTEIAFDGPSAIHAAKRFRPEIVFLDLGLPGMDGYEVAAQLRSIAELASLKLFALTGYGQTSDREKTRDSGFNGHLVKPIDFAQLAEFLGASRGSRPP